MKTKLSNIAMSFFAALIAAAPVVDVTTMCMGPWGEPDYPNEKDYS